MDHLNHQNGKLHDNYQVETHNPKPLLTAIHDVHNENFIKFTPNFNNNQEEISRMLHMKHTENRQTGIQTVQSTASNFYPCNLDLRPIGPKVINKPGCLKFKGIKSTKPDDPGYSMLRVNNNNNGIYIAAIRS